MEMGSSSLGVPGGSRSNESLHGLKFGKKIFFEDVGSGGAAAANAPAPAKKGRGVGQGGQQPPPRCQVEGCKVDLTGAKAYYCRHKVCAMHSKSPKVVVNGMEQRFCQQCSRFHQLLEFDQGKRSCRRRLAGHNERRRKPPPGPLSSRYGHLSSSFHDGGRFGGFLMDFTYPRQPSGARGMWPTVRANDHPVADPWQGTLDAPPSSRVPTQLVNPYGRGSTGGLLFAHHEIQTSECLGVSDSRCALSLLSNQPWVAAASAASSRAPMISTNTHGGAQMAQSTAATSFMNNPWSIKGHGTSGGMHEIPPEMSLGLAAEPSNRRFSGELELALQGSREHSSSNSLVHWSL